MQNRYDFLYMFDVKDGNPNGDPDQGNVVLPIYFIEFFQQSHLYVGWEDCFVTKNCLFKKYGILLKICEVSLQLNPMIAKANS